MELLRDTLDAANATIGNLDVPGIWPPWLEQPLLLQ
jgi:hypothetical protein